MTFPSPEDVARSAVASADIPEALQVVVADLIERTIRMRDRQICSMLQQELAETQGSLVKVRRAIELMLYPKG